MEFLKFTRLDYFIENESVALIRGARPVHCALVQPLIVPGQLANTISIIPRACSSACPLFRIDGIKYREGDHLAIDPAAPVADPDYLFIKLCKGETIEVMKSPLIAAKIPLKKDFLSRL